MIPPVMYTTTEKPFCVTTICDCKTLTDFIGSNVGLGFGIGGKEEIINASGRNGKVGVSPSYVDAPVRLASCVAKRLVCTVLWRSKYHWCPACRKPYKPLSSCQYGEPEPSGATM